jgi:hypothetical protein
MASDGPSHMDALLRAAATPRRSCSGAGTSIPCCSQLSAAALALVLVSRTLSRPTGLVALAVLAVIFVSPLCALSSALFSARTVHHILLIAVAGPLLAWSLSRSNGRGLAWATFFQTVIFWAWHAPAAYALALSHDVVYWLMQASLLEARSCSGGPCAAPRPPAPSARC